MRMVLELLRRRVTIVGRELGGCDRARGAIRDGKVETSIRIR